MVRRRKQASQLAAAFVVTVAGSGCGEGGRSYPPNPPPQAQIDRQPDGKCMETIFGNPPLTREVPCPESMGGPAPSAAPTGSATAAPTAEPTASPSAKKDLPPAPAGWPVRRLADGTCMVGGGPDPCQHPGCNPPPSMHVACPPQSPDQK